MTKLTVPTGLLFLQGMAACGIQETYVVEKPNPHFQMRITGFGLANLRSTIHSKGQQETWMFGGPAQEMFFVNSDTIQHLFVLGKKDVAQHFDSAAIGRNETMTFTLKIEKHKSFKPIKSNHKALFLVELLVDGQVVKSVQIPARVAGKKQPAARDSVATLTFDTSTL